MWKHELIESLGSGCPVGHEEEWTALVGLVDKAQTFYFGHVESIEDILKERDGKESPLWINVPYPLTLVEWQDHRPEQDPKRTVLSPKRAVLIHSQEERGLQTYYDFYYATADVPPEMSSEVKQITDWFVSLVAFECDRESPWLLNWSNADTDSMFSEEALDDLILDTQRDVSVARIFLDLLNSKQAVLTQDVPAPIKLNAKRARMGRCPVHSFKILEVVKKIDEPKEGKKPQRIERIYEGMREHTVRAHEKTYVKERPLFGKFAGTFKWKEQKRGSKDLGTVEKEYHVKTQGHKKEASDERI